MVAIVRCVPAGRSENSGVPSLRFGGLVHSRDDHRSTGYQGISDQERSLPAGTRHTKVTGSPHPLYLTIGLRGQHMTSVARIFVLRRILLGHSLPSRPAQRHHPSPLSPAQELVGFLQRPLDQQLAPHGATGRSTGDTRGRAHRGLRTHRRHADRRPGLPGRHSRLAVPAPLRLACHFRRAPRHGGARFLAVGTRPSGRGRAAGRRPAPLPGRLPRPGIGVGHLTRHRPRDGLHAAA